MTNCRSALVGVLALVALVFIAGSGRVFAQSLTAEQEKGLAEGRRMAAEVARIYKVPEVGISAAEWVGKMGTFNTYSDGRWLFVHPRVFDAPGREVFLAQMLAMHVRYWQRHGSRAYPPNTTTEEYRRVREQEYLEDNAKTVEVLTRAKGWSEWDALRGVYSLLLGSHRAEAAGRPRVPYRRSACDEIKDLLARFPQHREAWANAECAPPPPG